MANTESNEENREYVIREFYRLEKISGAHVALQFLRPKCMSDLTYALEYAAFALRADMPFEAMAILAPHYSAHRENSWFIAVLLVALESCKTITSNMTEQIFDSIPNIQWNKTASDRIPEIDRYFELAVYAGVAPSKLLIDEYTRIFPQSEIPKTMSRLAPAYFRTQPPNYNRANAIFIPDAPVFQESSDERKQPFSIGASFVDVGKTEFVQLHNVKLYMLPGMYGLVETSPGIFYANNPIGAAFTGESHLISNYGGKTFLNSDHYSYKLTETVIENPVIIPFRLSGSYYFHFVTETLQAIFDAANQFPTTEIILPDADGFFDRVSRTVYEEAIQAVAMRPQNLRWLKEGVYRLRVAYMPSVYQYCNLMIQDSIIKIANEKAIKTDNNKIVLISRRQNMIRSVLNGAEVAESVIKMFPEAEIVFLEDLKFFEQVNLFNRAKVVIGPHGGGMTNILFCKPGTSIIEFQLPGQGIMYRHIAHVLGLRYTAYVPEHFDAATSGFVIDCNKLVECISAELSARDD